MELGALFCISFPHAILDKSCADGGAPDVHEWNHRYLTKIRELLQSWPNVVLKAQFHGNICHNGEELYTIEPEPFSARMPRQW